jgi:hypothetical protein
LIRFIRILRTRHLEFMARGAALLFACGHTNANVASLVDVAK